MPLTVLHYDKAITSAQKLLEEARTQKQWIMVRIYSNIIAQYAMKAEKASKK